MNAWRACLAVLLSAIVPAASAAPAERALSVVATQLPAAASVKLPALPVSGLTPGQSLSGILSEIPSVDVQPMGSVRILGASAVERIPTVAGHSRHVGEIPGLAEAAAPHSAAAPASYENVRAAIASEKSPESLGSVIFDGSTKRDGTTPSVKAAALGVLAPAVALGASHAAALGRAFSAISYNIANGSSLIFPLPDIHRAFSHVKAIPPWRAALGAVGAALVGLMNATVLVKPFWGTMHVFIGLGLLAPYFISRHLQKRGVAFAYVGPQQGTRAALLWARVKSDKALHYTLATGALLLAASAGIYFSALAVVPHLLAATFSQPAVEAILFAVQLLKAVFFAIVFAPDALDMVKGKKPHGFSLWLDLLFILSTSAFVAWGVQAALASPPGMIRRQYLVHAVRNLIEAVAATISVISLRRAARRH